MADKSESLGDAYVNILGNLNPLAAAFVQGEAMATAFAGTMRTTLMRGAATFAAPFLAGLSLKGIMSEWMGKEVVINDLAIALKSVGENVDLYLPGFQKFANEMESITTHSNEAIMASMAYAQVMGIQTKQLEETTRAAIGLSAKLGIGLSGAMQLLIRASHGSTQRLKMYGIELDQNATKQQKFARLLKIGAEAMPLAEGKANTLSGQLTILKNAWGGMLAEVGHGLSEPLKGTGESAVKAVSAWTAALEQMRSSGNLAGITAYVQAFISTIWTFIRMVVNGFKTIWTAIMVPINLAIDQIVADVMFLVDVIERLGQKTPNKSWGQIFEDRSRYAKASFGSIGSDFDKLGKEAVSIMSDASSRLNNIGGVSWINKGGKEKPGKKSPIQSAIEGKAGEVFSFADAWTRMQKSAAKEADSDNLEQIAESTRTIAENTRPSTTNDPIGQQRIPPPLSFTPGGEEFVPGATNKSGLSLLNVNFNSVPFSVKG
jgi:hypothetical protein